RCRAVACGSSDPHGDRGPVPATRGAWRRRAAFRNRRRAGGDPATAVVGAGSGAGHDGARGRVADGGAGRPARHALGAASGKRETGYGIRVSHGRHWAASRHGLRAGAHGHRSGPVQRARWDPRRVWVRDGGTGAARVVGRRHRIAPDVRPRHPTIRRRHRAGDDPARANGGPGFSAGRGAACCGPTTAVALGPAPQRCPARSRAGVGAGAGSGARVGRGGPPSRGRAAAGRGAAGAGGAVRRSGGVAGAARPVPADRARPRRCGCTVPDRAARAGRPRHQAAAPGRRDRAAAEGDAPPPRLHRLGTTTWQRQRDKTRAAIRQMAIELLDLYARRQLAAGFAFPPDTPWQRELESAFLYEDTPDQRRASEEVKRDMERARPMDRLLVGDVGYGKTEVALRAAFKAVQAGKQVAVLVPTTILAEQHGRTFRERLADYPVRIEVLSRFRSAKETAPLVQRLAAGEVDIVIGTHRLLSPDVTFKDLGLLVVDEEHRFGVRHKERLKALKL